MTPNLRETAKKQNPIQKIRNRKKFRKRNKNASAIQFLLLRQTYDMFYIRHRTMSTIYIRVFQNLHLHPAHSACFISTPGSCPQGLLQNATYIQYIGEIHEFLVLYFVYNSYLATSKLSIQIKENRCSSSCCVSGKEEKVCWLVWYFLVRSFFKLIYNI